MDLIDEEYNDHGDSWYRKITNRHGLVLYFNEKSQLHRLDGPAKLYKSGFQEWWINNQNVTREFVIWANERGIDQYNLSDFDKVIIRTEFFCFYINKSDFSC